MDEQTEQIEEAAEGRDGGAPPAGKKINKKLNTLLFMLGAVVLCCLLTIVVFFALFLLTILLHKITGLDILLSLLPALFILALVGSFFLYNAIVRRILRSIDIDEYFDPLKLRLWK